MRSTKGTEFDAVARSGRMLARWVEETLKNEASNDLLLRFSD